MCWCDPNKRTPVCDTCPEEKKAGWTDGKPANPGSGWSTEPIDPGYKTVAEVIEALKRLPPEAKVRSVHTSAGGISMITG